MARRRRVLDYYLPQPYISKLEHGRYPWGFTERNATALAAALGVALTDMTESRLFTSAEEELIRGWLASSTPSWSAARRRAEAA